MSNIKFSIDENQFGKIIEKIRKKEPEKKFNIDKLLNVIQVIAIVISGCWIFYKYKTHDELSAKLQNENLKLQNTLHHEMDLYTVHLAQLDEQRAIQDLNLKDVDLKFKEKMALIDYNTKVIDNESKELNIKYAETLIKFDIEHNRIRNKKDSIAYIKDIDNRYKSTATFNCKLIDTLNKTYLGNFYFEIENISEIEFDISGMVLGVYISKLKLGPSYNQNNLIYPLSYPPYFYDPIKNDNWDLLQQEAFTSYKSSVNFDNTLAKLLNPKAAKPLKGSSITGPLKSGAKAFTNYSFYFTSNPENIIGLNIEIIFNEKFIDTYHTDALAVLKFL